MFKSLIKIIAYFKAPRQTFMTLHPLKTIKLGMLLLFAGWLFSVGKKRNEPARTGEP